jgi:hypothetical protein
LPESGTSEDLGAFIPPRAGFNGKPTQFGEKKAISPDTRKHTSGAEDMPEKEMAGGISSEPGSAETV